MHFQLLHRLRILDVSQRMKVNRKETEMLTSQNDNNQLKDDMERRNPLTERRLLHKNNHREYSIQEIVAA